MDISFLHDQTDITEEVIVYQKYLIFHPYVLHRNEHGKITFIGFIPNSLSIVTEQ